MTHSISQIARGLRLDRLPLIGGGLRRVGRVVNQAMYRDQGVEAVIDRQVTLKLSPRAFSGGSFLFEPNLTHALRELASPEREFMDIGGHIGIASLLYAHFSGGTARVASFEPNPTTFPLLVENVRLNPYGIETYRLALADKIGSADFYFYGSAQNASLSAGAPKAGLAAQGVPETALESARVSTSTVDDFCAAIGLRPGLLKIDVEGAELQVLRGATRILKTVRPSIFMETHVFAWPSFGYSAVDLESFIRDHGYAARDISGNRLTGTIGSGPQADNNYYLLEPE